MTLPRPLIRPAIRYGSLAIRLTTHDAGGITERDVALATRIESLTA